jgi:hypothetical protein
LIRFSALKIAVSAEARLFFIGARADSPNNGAQRYTSNYARTAQMLPIFRLLKTASLGDKEAYARLATFGAFLFFAAFL